MSVCVGVERREGGEEEEEGEGREGGETREEEKRRENQVARPTWDGDGWTDLLILSHSHLD